MLVIGLQGFPAEEWVRSLPVQEKTIHGFSNASSFGRKEIFHLYDAEHAARFKRNRRYHDFPIGAKGNNRAIANTEYKASMQAWETGRKMPWEKPVPSAQVFDLRHP